MLTLGRGLKPKCQSRAWSPQVITTVKNYSTIHGNESGYSGLAYGPRKVLLTNSHNNPQYHTNVWNISHPLIYLLSFSEASCEIAVISILHTRKWRLREVSNFPQGRVSKRQGRSWNSALIFGCSETQGLVPMFHVRGMQPNIWSCKAICLGFLKR